MRAPATSLALLFLWSVCPPALSAQDEAAAPDRPPIQMDSLLEVMQHAWNQPPAADPHSPAATFGLNSDCSALSDEVTREGCWRAYQRLFAYYDFGFGHRQTVFWWTHWSSRIIFVVVLGLVCAGMYFAWLQFRHDLRLPPELEREGGGSPLHHVEIGKAGIKVSSPVLGVVILVISLAFFYLYLVYVYPITEIL